MSTNNFNSAVTTLFQGMDGIINSKTVVGDAVHVGETIIIPLIDVSFGIGAGAFSGERGERSAGGIGGKMSTSALLVIQNGRTKLVNVKNQDSLIRILDLIPELLDRYEMSRGRRMTEEEIADVLKKADEE